MEASTSRRLGAIMFADMVGYSSLSQKSETLALEMLSDLRDIVRPFFTEHEGTEIKSMGDGFLVEFGSALEAVRCAVKIQEGVHQRNGDRPTREQIWVRIGVHLGDIVHDRGDIYGDAVNIASRIEPLAEPGGICVSADVYQQVKNKVDYSFSRRGLQQLKNIGSPVETYEIALPWGKGGAVEERAPLDRRRVAVLPFANISPDSQDEYFADGMTEELISNLSSIQNLGVIGRTSVMRYRGTNKGVNEIAHELNVGALLEGSVRKADNKLRVTVKLVDGSSEEQLWSKTYDREMNDVFAIQSEIAHNVAGAMEVQLGASERQRMLSRTTGSILAHTLYLKGRFNWNKRTEEGIRMAIALFDQAIKEDAQYALAYVGLADCYRILGSRGFANPAEVFPESERLARKALELDDSLAEAHAALAASLENKWDLSGAEREYKRAILLNPSYASVYQWYGLFLGHMARFQEGIEKTRMAVKLDPFSPLMAGAHFEELYLSRRYDEAMSHAKKALSIDPKFPSIHYSLGQVYLQASKSENAIRELRQALSLSAGDSEIKAYLGYAYGVSGDTKSAREILDDLYATAKSKFVFSDSIAQVHLGLGEKNKAFELLNSAWKEKSPGLKHLMTDPVYDSLRSDPRYGELLRQTGLQQGLGRAEVRSG